MDGKNVLAEGSTILRRRGQKSRFELLPPALPTRK